MENKKLLEKIELLITENGKMAGYENVTLTEQPSAKPVVGIWWYLQGKVVKLASAPENCEKEEMLCVSQEHNRIFPFFQKQYAAQIPEILEVRYNQIERGRVWAVLDPDDTTKITKYMITCSTSFSKNYDGIAAVKKSFGVDKPCGVQIHSGMYDWEIKLK